MAACWTRHVRKLFKGDVLFRSRQSIQRLRQGSDFKDVPTVLATMGRHLHTQSRDSAKVTVELPMTPDIEWSRPTTVEGFGLKSDVTLPNFPMP